MEKTQEVFTKYEKARILGARGLQLSMDAPILVKVDSDILSNLNFDPLKIAELELSSGVLPITVRRPLPERKEERLDKIKIESQVSDEEKLRVESRDEKEISEEGEIMELANPEDEFEAFEESESSNELE